MGKTIARIYLSNFEHNIHAIKELAPGKKICMALKANAYGHGLVQLAQKSAELGIEYLSVATVSEAIKLRNAGITLPILLLSLCHKDELYNVVEYAITPLVADTDFIDLLHDAVIEKMNDPFPVHIKIDTGMSRHGVQESDALKLAKHIQSKGSLRIEGTCTHFAVSDSILKEDIAFTKKQVEKFKTVVATFDKHNIDPGILHCAASGGILLHPDAHFDMIRPGILSYGYFPSVELQDFYKNKQEVFKPVMELVTYVTALKEIREGESVSYGRTWVANDATSIATLSTGYGDGLHRSLSGNILVTIGKKQYPVIGRICMDQCVIALDAYNNVKRWEEAIIFGPSENCNTAMDIALKIDTIPYEVLCLITSRVERVFVQ